MITFRNGIIHMQEEDNPRRAYDEVRAAVYDNELPLIKVIGFKAVDVSNPDSVRVSDRHNAILENMIELSGTFSELIFLPHYNSTLKKYMLNSNIINIGESLGKITAANADFKSGGASLAALNRDLYLFHALQSIHFRLIAIESTGFITMEKSVDTIKRLCEGMDGFDPNSYFPLNNEFSAIDYIRVLPPVGDQYRYTLRKGMNDTILNILWGRKKERNPRC